MRRVWVVGVVLLVAAAAAAAWAVWSRQNPGGEQDLVAWWAGVAKESLVRDGPDRTITVPGSRVALTHRNYKLAPGAQVSPREPGLSRVWVLVGERCVVASWRPPAEAKRRSKPLTQEQAQKVAEQFLRSRGLLDGARLLKAGVAAEDKHGQVTAYRFKYRVRNGDREADVTIQVDPRYGFVRLASYSEEPPPNLTRQPLISMEEARERVIKYVAERGWVKWRIRSQLLWGREPGYPPGYPIYAFSVVGERRLPSGEIVLEGWRVIVDGVTGRVGGGDIHVKPRQ